MSLYDLLPGMVEGLEIEPPFETQCNLNVVSAARRHLFQQPEPLLREGCGARTEDRPRRNGLLYTDSFFLTQGRDQPPGLFRFRRRSEEHTSELQSHSD